MHIHKFERFWIGLSFVLIAGFIATVVIGFTTFDLKVIGKNKTIDPTKLAETTFAKPGVRKVERNGKTEYDVYVVARQFLFQPGTGNPITVPANERITFHITSPDVIHGFEAVGTNLNTMVIPGEIAKFTTIFPEPKTYGILCNEYCGAAHHAMEGKIEVVPKSQFNESMLVQ
ncbi:MAG TPA: cytochrome c oxidase subunit II [Bacteroidales bacterium]|nr:cytochrome c oxidase subunit II [Bacteroidales bacterium]